MSEKIVREIGGCEVTITFKGHNDEVKDKVLWQLMENYMARITEESKQIVLTEPIPKAS